VSNDDDTRTVWGYPLTDVTNGGTATDVVVSDSAPEGTRGHWVSVSEVAPRDTSEEAPSVVAEAPAESPEVTALKAQLSAAEGRESTLKHVITSMERDLAIIGDSLKETADRHEWCGQYEEHLEELLGKLSGYSGDILREHAERAQDFTVTVTFTTTVRATDRDNAIEQAQEGAMEYDAYMGNWDAEED
jgi:ABC-type amino acid transport substrate-binding protein